MPVRRSSSWLRRAGPLLALAFPGLLAVVVMASALTLGLRGAGIEEERDEAELEATLAGDVVVAPRITPALMRGDRAAVADLDAAVREHVVGGPIERVKLWSPDGVIVYSDEPRLIGERFELGRDKLEVLASGGATSDLSDLGALENRFERDHAPLLEVYTRVEAPGGTVLLFEVYHEFDSLAASADSLFVELLPALGGGLLLLGLGNLAAARWFARYVRRRDEQRAALLARALHASDTERRLIAADLHDGVVQDLTAALFTIQSAEPSAGTDTADDVTASVRHEVAETIRRSLAALRTALVDVYPAELEAQGLPAALSALLARARESGLETRLDVPADLQAPTATAGLLYRVAQESLRNTIAHASARHVSVSAGADADRYWLDVRDDGRGFDPEQPSADGHFGLRLVRDLVTDAGGRVSVQSAPGEGSVVRAEIPAAIEDPVNRAA